MKRNDLVYLRHIVDAVERIERHIDGVDERTFLGNELVQDGVIRQLEIIGEAVKHLSATVRKKHPNIPWRSIAGTRDTLIHRYFGVDLDEIWLAVQRDIPVLKKAISEMLEEDRTSP